MKRYDVEHTVWGDLSIVQRSNGDWVKWDDVQELIQTLKEARLVVDGVCEEYRAYRGLLNKIDKVLNNIEGTK